MHTTKVLFLLSQLLFISTFGQHYVAPMPMHHQSISRPSIINDTVEIFFNEEWVNKGYQRVVSSFVRNFQINLQSCFYKI